MITKVVGWTIDEYKAWADKHKEVRQATGLRKDTPDEVRLNFDTKPAKIIGYASLFDSWYELYPGFREAVAPGAFRKSIQSDDVRALWNHNPDHVLGRTKAQTLALIEDDKGLRYEITPPETTMAKDLMVSIKRGDVSQSSFGFNIVAQLVEYDKKQDLVSRTLTEVQLWDVSPVTYPASPQTEVSVRGIAGSSEGSEETIEVSGVVVPPLSDDQLFQQFESLKGRIS
jgi:HK97 family phage prohead protease